MIRLLLALFGVVLLSITALGALWLAGQLLLGVGLFATGVAGTLLRVMWFVVVAAVLGGASFFVANAWRPVGKPLQPQGRERSASFEPLQTIVASAKPPPPGDTAPEHVPRSDS